MIRRSNRLRTLRNLQNINYEDSSNSTDSSSQSDQNDDLSVSENESEISDESEEENETEDIRNVNDHRSADGTEWFDDNSSRGRFFSSNIIRHNSGPTLLARAAINNTASSAFNLLLTDNELEKICGYTNGYARSLNIELNLDLGLIKKFLGLVIARAVYAAKKTPVNGLWSNDYGIAIFKKTMPRDEFKRILKFFRLDDPLTRSQRMLDNDDKFAACSEIWYSVINNFQKYLLPNEDVCVDEQLFNTKSRCKFIQYIPSKPGKFGIKFWMLVEKEHNYILNSFPYLGKDETRPENKLLGEHIVMKIMEPYLDMGLNVCCDNFFTTKQLAEDLLDRKTTLLGTVRGNKKFLPQISKKKMKKFESKILYTERNISLTTYQSKEKKTVHLLSSMHRNVSIDRDSRKLLPETVKDYNELKCSVDIADKMMKDHTTKVPAKRWVMQVFYNLLDMSILNSYLLYVAVNKSKISRLNYMKMLVDELIGKVNERETIVTADRFSSLRTCCITKCKNKTNRVCFECRKPICGTHSTVKCCTH